MTQSRTSSDSRWLALVVLCAGMLMIVLDQTIVNVALPAIQSDLGFSQASLAWVVNAYLIGYGGLLLLSGRLGDLIGRKRILMVGLAVFTLASLICGLSVNQELLVVGRFIQGVGGAMASGLILGMIVTMFPEHRERARAIGVFSFVAAAGGSTGLLAGGLITQAVSWHWIFYVNLPIGLAALLLAARLVPGDRGIGLGEGADFSGAVLGTAALMLGVYAIVGSADHDRSSSQTLAMGGVAVGLLVGFLIRQATAANPLLPLETFRSRNVSGANVIQILMVAGIFGMFFLGSLFMQRVLNYDALQIGLAFMPVAVGIGLLSVEISARLATRFGARAMLVAGLLQILAGLVLFSRVPMDAQYLRDILPAMVLIGIGAGLSFPALMTLAMSDATPRDAGLASGLVGTSAQAGGAFGLSVLATLATSHTERLMLDGHSAASALTGGYQLAFTLSAGFVLAAAVLAATVLRPVAVSQEESAISI